MNSIPILKSKLIMPELSESFFMTNRISSLHKEMDSCRAVTLCAPAGYGKTTFAVSYFVHQAATPFRVCWYRLDPEDKTPSIFIHHLVESVFPSESDEFAESRIALSDVPSIELQPYNAYPIICHEMWAHHSQTSNNRTYIVLDDFHHASQNQDICAIIRYLLNNLPPSCTIIVLSRGFLNLFTEKQKLENKVLEIGLNELAFTNEEIENLMINIRQSHSGSKLTDIIFTSTEGWITGVLLLYQAFKDKNVDTLPFELGIVGHEEALFRYMSQEVLKSVDEDTQKSMGKLALLQDFSEAEALEILRIDNIHSLMNQCISFGMFIQKILGNPVVYRFHSLFRQFLLSIFRNSCTEKELFELNLKAAEYYMFNGAYGRAAEYLAECGNSPSAMSIVIKAGFNKFMIGETGQLKMWLDLLPDNIIRDNPVLLLFKAQLVSNSEQLGMIEPLKKVLFQSLNSKNLQIYYDVASVLIYIYNCTNDMKGLLELSKCNLGQSESVSPSLGNSLALLDMVRFIAEEDFLGAETQLKNIQCSLLPEDSQWLYLILSCIVYYCLGKLDHAERCMERALVLYKFKNIEPTKGFILLFLSFVQTLKNKKEGLSPYLDEVSTIGEKYNYEYLLAHAKRLAAFERYLSFDREASLELLDYAAFYFHQLNNRAMTAACKLLRHLWSIGYNDQVPDIGEALEDLSTIHQASPGLMVYESSLSITGVIARESGDFALAEQNLLASIKAAKIKKGNQVLTGTLFHIAKLYFVWGDTLQGHQYLKQALELAAANRYFMFWDIHVPTLVEMTLRGIRYNYFPNFAVELLGRFYDNTTINYLIEKLKAIDENQITAFVNNFISTYKAEKSKQLYLVKASLFGKAEIIINGVKILDTEWKTKKTKYFFEYLMLKSGDSVSKEQLADIFWPDSDSKSAIASQRTALYYLRKILSKYNAVVTGNNSFIYETLEGLQIRRNDALNIDIHEFLDLYTKLSQLGENTPQNEQQQIEILERMIHIYKGDLLEGNDYSDLVIHERERLKSIFIKACQKLGSIFVGRGELSKAEEILKRALAIEPYDENICLKLLRIYELQGRRSKALKLYYRFKKLLEQELDIKVDTKLTKAIRQISSGQG